jgi:hypothetical protein
MDVGTYAVSVPLFERMLGNLDGILNKAEKYLETKKIDADALLQARLYPDMFPLLRQVQLASDFAKGATARLAGIEVPKYEDKESSFAELHERIQTTLRFIKSVDVAAVNAGARRAISIPMRDRTLNFEGLDYLTQMVLPNFFFHVTTAYDILRHNGVEVGKRDFVGV